MGNGGKIMKNKSWLYILLFVLIGVIVIGVLIYKNFHYDEKKLTVEKIDNYLNENNYDQKILKKEIEFDSKTGGYFARVVFKDEPNNFYEIISESGSNKVKVYGYHDGVEIVDKNKGKYITEYSYKISK